MVDFGELGISFRLEQIEALQERTALMKKSADDDTKNVTHVALGAGGRYYYCYHSDGPFCF